MTISASKEAPGIGAATTMAMVPYVSPFIATQNSVPVRTTHITANTPLILLLHARPTIMVPTLPAASSLVHPLE